MNAIKKILKRYFVDALGAMALGLFSSLIIGLIISQFAKIPGLSVLNDVAAVVKNDYVVGAAIGVAVAWGLKVKPLTMFSAAAVGAVGYVFGGPVGAFVAAVVGAEIGNILAGKTKVDIVITPLITILSGGLVGIFVGPWLSKFMTALGDLVNSATELQPVWMGIVVAVIVGLALTAPISSAALCIMIGLDGVAAGAACVGCCCQMVGFAVASWRDNGLGGTLSQMFGTSMLQFSNIVRRPAIWLAPTLASAVLGPISAAVLKMTNTPMGAGMGTSGLVGQFNAYDAMSAGTPLWIFLLELVIMHFVLPACLTLAFDAIFRKIGWVKNGDMKIYEAK
ncbi:MAG: PTS sugar transporter subunit IIC [Clostridia bacterium]|nr:PTS sugar transporter subunit IIC [Clostridia bacterium]MBQ1965287.1 PTS sugar transporter subunit IIC [Clostridia bacterium]MBQ5743335.1 PTS sugar transporter subunit IIC [Clostridia bacterium]